MTTALTWTLRTDGRAYDGEPGGYVVQLIRSDIGRIKYCQVYRYVDDRRIDIGKVGSVVKAKAKAERHAAATAQPFTIKPAL